MAPLLKMKSLVLFLIKQKNQVKKEQQYKKNKDRQITFEYQKSMFRKTIGGEHF